MKITVEWVSDRRIITDNSSIPEFNVNSTELDIDDSFDLDGSLERDELEIVEMAAKFDDMPFSRQTAMLVHVIG